MRERGHRIGLGLTLWAALAGAALGQTAQDVPISAKTPADFKALREMPLFAPDRRAPMTFVEPEAPPLMEVAAPPPPPPPPAAAAPDWQLVGLVRSDRIRSAMFRSSTEPEFTLRQGESRDGWTLTEVGRFEVTLDSSTGRASVHFPDTSTAEGFSPPDMPLEPQL